MVGDEGAFWDGDFGDGWGVDLDEVGGEPEDAFFAGGADGGPGEEDGGMAAGEEGPDGDVDALIRGVDGEAAVVVAEAEGHALHGEFLAFGKVLAGVALGDFFPTAEAGKEPADEAPEEGEGDEESEDGGEVFHFG